MNTVVADLRYAFRGLRRDPGFAVVTCLSLAVGVGAVLASFAVIDALDFRPLPYRAPDELVVVSQVKRTTGEACGTCRSSPTAVRLWQSEARSFRSVAIFEETGARWYNGNRVERLLTSDVSENFFSVLGVPPVLGRTFTAEEAASGSARVIIVAYEFWRTRLGGDTTILGRPLDLQTSHGRVPYTIIGIMPPAFRFLDNQAWLPLAQPSGGAERRYVAIGRLRPRVTLSSAAAEARRLSAQLAATIPATYGSWTARVLPFREWVHKSRSDVGRGRVLLFGISLFVLLVAALNVASLSISRAGIRSHDIGIRSALGASRSRLIRLCLTESGALAVIGGGLGLLIAAATGHVTTRMLRLSDAGLSAQIDWRVLGLALFTTCLAGVGTGIVPALNSTRGRLSATLGQRRGDHSWRGARVQAGLVVLEVACSLILLTAGGLLAKELFRLQQLAPGFDPRDLYLVQASRPGIAEAERQRAYASRAGLDLVAIPEVAEIGLTGLPPSGVSMWLEGSLEPLPPQEQPMIMLADSAFFATIDVRPLAGRVFSEADRFGSPPVAVVNETAATRLWPDGNAIGRRLALGDAVQHVVQVVGVIPDVKVFNAPLKEAAPPIVYRPFEQSPTPYPLFVVRGRAAARELVPTLRRAVAQLTHAPVPPYGVVAIEAMHRREISQERLRSIGLNSFAGFALFLASVGIYGIMSYTTSQRRREIGIRMALGATPRRVILGLVRNGLTVVGIGLLLGLLGSRVVTWGMRALIPGTSVTDGWVLGGALLVLAVVLGAAILLPAYQATRADSSRALRE